MSFNTKCNVCCRQDILNYIFLILVSIVFLLIHSFNTSPFYIGYGGDSANYLIMGKMLLAGKIPYLDFFDHKGPMMIFIEALGQSIISDRLGIFILQTFNLSLTLLLVYRIARLFINEVNSLTVTLTSLLFFAFTMEGGNLTEEYSLPFLLFSLYMALKVLLTDFKSIKPIYIILLGISAAFLLWIRMNNTNVALASAIFIFIVTLKDGNIKGLRNFVLYYLLGFLLVTLPLCYYFYSKDAFYEMFFAAFIYNFKYIGINESPSPFHSLVDTFFYLLKAWTPFVVLLIGTIVYYINNKPSYKIILLSTLLIVIGYASTHVGAAYYHYMTLNIPCLVLGLIYILKADSLRSRKVSIVLCVSVFVVLSLFTVHKFSANGAFKKWDKAFISDSRDIIDQIPQSDRNSIYAYHTMTRFHASSQSFPCFKYFMMQEWQGKYNPDLLNEINAMLVNDPPQWIVTQFRDQSTNRKFWEIVESKYELYYVNNHFELFRLKKSK